MVETFLELAAALGASSTRAQRVRIQGRMSQVLAQDPAQVRGLGTIFHALTYGDMGTNFQGIMDGEYYRTSLRTYVDDDGTTRVALSVTFLQDHRDPEDGLDALVLGALVTAVDEHRLAGLINDITVNASQWRNGDTTHWGGPHG